MKSFSALESISELVAFLATPGKSASQLAEYLNTQSFLPFDPLATFLCALKPTGLIEIIGSFSIIDVGIEEWHSINIDEGSPIADAIRLDELVWISDKSDWESLYFESAKLNPVILENSFVALPFETLGSPSGVVGFLGKKNIAPTAEIQSYLWTVAGLVGLYLSRETTLSGSDEVKITRKFLSRRQNAIVDFLREGLTNQEIAKALGFSESTIRQETMRIYQLLHVSNRKEAAAFVFTGEE